MEAKQLFQYDEKQFWTLLGEVFSAGQFLVTENNSFLHSMRDMNFCLQGSAYPVTECPQSLTLNKILVIQLLSGSQVMAEFSEREEFRDLSFR